MQPNEERVHPDTTDNSGQRSALTSVSEFNRWAKAEVMQIGQASLVICCVLAAHASLHAASTSDTSCVQLAALDYFLSTRKTNNVVYFVEVEGTDPTDEFLLSASSGGRRVAKRSEATFSKQDGARSLSSGERGLIISVSKPKFVSEDRCKLVVGFTGKSMDDGGTVFEFVRSEGEWHFESIVLEWIS